MSKVNLFFEVLQDISIAEHIQNHKIIRLKVGVQFKTNDGWSKPYAAIIDTGAHTSVIPLSIWKNLIHESLGEYKKLNKPKPIDEKSVSIFSLYPQISQKHNI